MRFVALNSVPHLQLVPPTDFRFVDRVDWLPLGETEFLLTAHFLPIAFRLDTAVPTVGALVDPAYQVRPLVSPEGKWLRGYQPIALRCLPFRLAKTKAINRLQSLEVSTDLGLTSSTNGVKIVEADGRISPGVAAIHAALTKMHDARGALADAIDQFVLTDLLVPLPDKPAKDSPSGQTKFFVIDSDRFHKANARAMAAMARHSFLSLDLATACLFSQRLLKGDFRPGTPAPEKVQSVPSDAYAEVAAAGFNPNLALDDSSLFSTDDLGSLNVTEPLSTIP